VERDLACFTVRRDDSSRNVTARALAERSPTTTAVDIEVALVEALSRAARAGCFDVVAQLARELEARRLARAGNVVRLDERERARS
jgi:hypothetical protein